MADPGTFGTEPLSVQGGPAGALVLHGFTGNPYSVRSIGEQLAAAGMTVEVPRLPGHGTAVADLVPMRWPDWAGAAEAAYLALAERCERVAVVGLSMGGTLACWLAAHHAEIAGIALVNPAVEPPDEELARAGRELLAAGTTLAPGIGSDIADPDSTGCSYDAMPIAAALSLFEALGAVPAVLGDIRCPVLLLSSREDHVVSPSDGDLVVASVGGPCERVWLERSFHVATLDYDRAEVERRTVAFVTGVTGGTATSAPAAP